jgi:hypothetical protein
VLAGALVQTQAAGSSEQLTDSNPLVMTAQRIRPDSAWETAYPVATFFKFAVCYRAGPRAVGGGSVPPSASVFMLFSARVNCAVRC